MVARLKLKEIDGRAPPGVNNILLAAEALRCKGASNGRWLLSLNPSLPVQIGRRDTQIAGNSQSNNYQAGYRKISVARLIP